MILHRLEKLGIGFEAGKEDVENSWPFLVMIHGAGGSSETWRNQVGSLGDSINTLALDLPGHGKSKTPPKTDIHEYGRWVGELLEGLFPEPVFLMGHSMGGAIAQETALLYPDLLKGLILVGTGPRLRVAPAFIQGLRSDFSNTLGSLLGFAYARGADPLLIREGIRLMKEAGPEVVPSDFESCDRFDRTADISKIRTSTLILCGEEDKLTPPRLSTRLHEAISGSRMAVLPNAGHMVMIEQPVAFNEAVREFILV